MISRLKKKDDIDERIRQLSNQQMVKTMNKKQLSSDDFKELGDLYLSKGDKKKALEYLYRAAEILSAGQGNKAKAIYKKILNISPIEMNACERIVEILSREGLVAEQTRYLLRAAQYYQNKGDVTKMTTVYRKIQEIDPANKTAETFFSRGKVSK